MSHPMLTTPREGPDRLLNDVSQKSFSNTDVVARSARASCLYLTIPIAHLLLDHPQLAKRTSVLHLHLAAVPALLTAQERQLPSIVSWKCDWHKPLLLRPRMCITEYLSQHCCKTIRVDVCAAVLLLAFQNVTLYSVPLSGWLGLLWKAL